MHENNRKPDDPVDDGGPERMRGRRRWIAHRRERPAWHAGPPTPTSTASGDDVIGIGTVIQTGDAPAEFCLGGVAESLPPQCSGPELVGWDWAAAEQQQTVNGVTWGTYAVQGTWDGTALSITQPSIPLSLYDTIRPEPPAYLDEANPGQSAAERLDQISAELAAQPLPGQLSWAPVNGYLVVQVVHDAGAIQSLVDTRFGADTVVVESALKPVM